MTPEGTLTFKRWKKEDKPIKETEKEGERDLSNSRRDDVLQAKEEIQCVGW